MSPLDKPNATLRLATRVSASRPGFVAQIALGTGLAILAVAFRIGLTPLLGDFTPWITAFPAVLVAALCGGVLAGAVALLGCALAGYFILLGSAGAPLITSVAHWASLVTFV